MDILYIYLATITLIGFSMMAADKGKAQKHQRRISENCLFIAAWIGGSVGVLLGMYAFRHKTQHRKFTIGVPFVIAAQIAMVLAVLYYLKMI